MIYINDPEFKMPDTCSECPLQDKETGRCQRIGISSEYRPVICPLKELDVDLDHIQSKIIDALCELGKIKNYMEVHRHDRNQV